DQVTAAPHVSANEMAATIVASDTPPAAQQREESIEQSAAEPAEEPADAVPVSTLAAAIAAPEQPQYVERVVEAEMQPSETHAAAPEQHVSAAAPIELAVAPDSIRSAAAVAIETPAAIAPAPAAAPVSTTSSASKVEDLADVLRAAGLELASTDPQKLRAAQEEAAKIVAAPRVPRERKPVPPQSTEPLVQVETRH
ncbi:MAG TPA: ribonuclease E/G, partial [Oxalicibacterium sp.]|nr:ribonuclease E/G [Oxalicibacterium sp.]